MNCRQMAQLVALYVEGDLRDVERIQVETHLRTCGECRTVAEDLKASQFLFKSIRQDLPDTDALLSLRERVLVAAGHLQIQTGFWHWPGSVRRGVLATLALIVAALGAWSFSSVRELDPVMLREAVIRVPSTPENAFYEPVVEPMPKTAAVIRPRKSLPLPVEDSPRLLCESLLDSVQFPGASLEEGCASSPVEPEADLTPVPAQMTIKLLTDDPKVIMYWIVEERRE